jgi:hypothetical protein
LLDGVSRREQGLTVISLKAYAKSQFLLALALVSLLTAAALSQSPPRRRQLKHSMQPDPPPVLFSIELGAPSTAAGVGENLETEITIKNTGDKDICHIGGGMRDFILEVRDSSGNRVAETPYGQAANGANGSTFCALVHPGDSIQGSAFLNKEFQLDKPGNYTAQAIRRNSSTTFIKSNIVAITITP